MKLTTKGFLIVIISLTFITPFYAQETSPRLIILKPGETIQWSDKGKNYYEPKIGGYSYTLKGEGKVEVTRASLKMPILGKISNVASSATDFVVSEDVIEMSLTYNRTDYICYPMIKTLVQLKTYSPEKYKYSNNHTLKVYLDDKLLFSKDMEKTAQIPSSQYFSLEIKPEDFIKILKSQKITIQLADTKINLQEKEIKASNELSDLVLPLNNKKISAERLKICSRVME